MLKGIAASEGIAIGKAWIYKEPDMTISPDPVDSGEIEREISRFKEHREKVRIDLEDMMEKTRLSLGDEKAEIFEGLIMVLTDEEFEDEIVSAVKDGSVRAEQAVSLVVEESAAQFEAMDDEYLRERAVDFRSIGKKLIISLLEINEPALDAIEDEVIIIADDLAPADTAKLNFETTLGFITAQGGKTSHSAIMARSLEIPAVVGVSGVTDGICQDDVVILDGSKGVVIVNPSDQDLAVYSEKQKEALRLKKELEGLRDLPAKTQDGHEVKLFANIGTPADIDGVIHYNAQGIGLFRSEFLFLNRDKLPSEDEQFNAYQNAARKMEGKKVIIRTMDIGGDKELPYLDLPKEENPFLGYRALRISLDREEMFQTQLRALLRASVYGNIAMMFPLVVSLDEFKRAKKAVQIAMDSLDRDGKEYNKHIELGIMIETPAAAMMADILAGEADFLSIGTNDLVQYSMAVDRGNRKIENLYNPFNPGVVRLINQVIKAGHSQGKWVGVCGELGSDERAVPLLLGMGIDEISMSSPSVPKIKKRIRALSLADCKNIVKKALLASTADEIIALITEEKWV